MRGNKSEFLNLSFIRPSIEFERKWLKAGHQNGHYPLRLPFASMAFHVSNIGCNNDWNDVRSKRINCMHNKNITVKRMNGILYASEAKIMMQSLAVSPRLFHKQCPSSLVTTPIKTQKKQFADIFTQIRAANLQQNRRRSHVI